MFTANKNSEYTKQVVINFEEMVECNSDCVDDCIEAVYSITSKFKNITESCIDEPQNYYYTIECSDEHEADEVEDYITSVFEELEEQYCCEEY